VRLFDLHAIVAFLMFAIFGSMVVTAAGYRHEARLVPLVVGIPALLLAAWQMYVEIRQGGSSADRGSEGSPRDVRTPQPGGHAATRSKEAEAVAWLLLVTGLVLAGGMVTGGTIGVMLCQRMWLRESWRTTFAGGLAAILVLHFCFERALGQTLFEGWLFEWIAK
jgi:hypothetical protein